MHDQAPLPAPKEGGEMAQLIGCVAEAKRFSDDFLTRVIKEEKTNKSPAGIDAGQARKKAKPSLIGQN